MHVSILYNRVLVTMMAEKLVKIADNIFKLRINPNLVVFGFCCKKAEGIFETFAYPNRRSTKMFTGE